MRLSDVFDAKSNSLNALRLALAAAVVISHSWILGGYGAEPQAGGAALGGWALYGFFGLSGFLITRSRLSGQSVSRFYRARFLRIFPAYFVCLLVVAFAFAPLTAKLAGEQYSLISAAGFVIRNFLLYPPVIAQPGIVGTLQNVPFQGYWNGPLWTLFFEAVAYVMIGVLASILPRRVLPFGVWLVFLMTTALSVAGYLGFVTLNPNLTKWNTLFIAFSAGALIFLYARKIQAGWPTDGVAVVALALVTLAGLVPQLGSLFFTYILIRLGIVLPFQKVGSKYDISYGFYIYGWPVQQCLALAFGKDLPITVFVLLSLTFTIVPAFLSYALVERPALNLKGYDRAAGKIEAARHLVRTSRS